MKALSRVSVERPRVPGDLPGDLERLRAMIEDVKNFAASIRARHPPVRSGLSSDPILTPSWDAELEERVEARTAQLQATLQEREVLLQEIHHRVKNNFQVISSLISLQARSLGPDGSRYALEECQMRVQAIALIHDQLFQSKDCARVPFAEYARNLIENVFRATEIKPERVRLELAMNDVALSVDKAIPCGLILNELITNSLKHAFPEGRSGTVRVELGRVTEDALRIAVKDDGAGLPPGFDIYRSPSLGLQLVCMLAEQVQAAIEVEAAPGTCFRLTLPVAS